MPTSPEALFSAMAHEARLRCLLLLFRGELCVCELTHALGLAQPTVSRHLAQLREAGWVEDRRQGLWVHYRLHPQLPAWAREVLAATEAGLSRASPYASDSRRLAKMANRPGALQCG